MASYRNRFPGRIIRLACCAAVGIAAATAGRTIAEEAPPEATAPAESPPARAIEEIVVTAQKTEQSLQDVPISISAIGGDFIHDAGMGDLTDVVDYVPNVRVDTDDPGSPQVFIRGFGTNTFNPSFEPSVGFVQDEIFFARGAYFTESMFDIERIEVLRGPQGTLFGKNTIAGVFNVVSASPHEELEADLNATVGSFGERRFEGGVGGMLGERFGARVAFLDWRQDGRLDNTKLHRNEDELRQQAGRLKLRLAPLDSLDFEVTATVSDTEIPFWPFQLRKLDADTRDFLEDYDPAIEDDPFDFQTSMDTRGFLDKGSDTIGGKLVWTLGDLVGVHDAEMVLVAGRSDLEIRQLSDLDVSPADIGKLFSNEDYRQYSLELRAAGRTNGPFGWGEGIQFVAGLFLFRTNYHLRASVNAGEELSAYLLTNDAAQLGTQGAAPGVPFAPIPGGVLPTLGAIIGEDFYRFDFMQETTTAAPFGQLTWDIGRFSITPGLRINWERKDADSIGQAVCAAKSVTGRCVMQTLLNANDYAVLGATRSELDVSPKLFLSYRWMDDLTTYAGWARGFKSGGINSISFTGEDLEFEPEKAQTFEGGAKGRFFDGTLAANLALYWTELENLQVLAFNGVFFDVDNAASATSRGLELDAQWLTPYEPLSIAGSLGIIHARYDSFPSAPAPVGNGINTLQDLSGKRIAFTPDRTATLSPTLTYHVFRNWPLSLALDVLHRGEQFTDTDLDPATRVPAHTTFSVRTRLGGESEVWSVSFGVKNLTDERVLNQVTDAVFFPGTFYAQQYPARELFGSVRLKW